MTRKECLDMAAQCVLQDRASQYGKVENNFEQIADLWEAYLHAPISALDVAMMMSLLKIARAKANPAHADSFVDIAGYAACGAELAGKAEAYRQSIEEAGAEYKKLRAEAEAQPEVHPGDKVLVTMPDGEDMHCIYVGESERPGCCCVRYLSGDNSGDADDTVPLEALRRPPETESGCCQNGNDHSPEVSAEPEFKPGDRVEALSFDGRRWEEGVVRRTEVLSGRRYYTVNLPNDEGHCLPAESVRRPATRAEGCEELVHDAPQTPAELCRRIVDSNPATYGHPHKPTGEELAEMAREEDADGGA